MEIFVASFVGLLLAGAAMALGVLLGREPLRRGCAGLAEADCEGCARPCARAAAGRERGR